MHYLKIKQRSDNWGNSQSDDRIFPLGILISINMFFLLSFTYFVISCVLLIEIQKICYNRMIKINSNF